MYIPNYPEDSVLRRHCDAAAAIDQQQWMEQGPSDAVLRRHWRQLEESPVTAAPAAGTAAAPQVRQTAAADASQPASRAGFLAWLGALFRRDS